MAKVLLVEDDNNLREIYEARLTAEGYEIITAQNGEEALSAAKQNKPDLVISDVMMPRISGFEMLDILRNTDELKNTKVIMLTALGQAEDRNRADNLGADKYLVKSQVTLEDIVNAAKELLADEPVVVTMPSVTPASTPVPEPVVATQVADPVATVQDELVETPVASAPIDLPEPVVAAQASVPVVPDDAVASAPVNPEPVVATVEPAMQPAPEFTAESPTTPDPTPTYTSTTVTVTDPDPITQRISPAAEPLEPETAPMSAPQVITPDQVVPDVIPSAPVNPEPVVATVEPVTQAAPETAAEPSAEPQTLAAEEAAIQAQIASFAAQEQPAAVVATATANDAILDDAINKLTADPNAVIPAAEPTPVVPPEVTDPAVEPVVDAPEQNDASAPLEVPVDTTSQITGRKVIQPLSEAEAGTTNLDVLLAQEEAKEATQVPANPQPVVISENPATPPQNGFDPNSIAL